MVTFKLSRPAMNCRFEMILCGTDESSLRDIAECALDEVQRLDRQLSCFNHTSEVSYVNAEAWKKPVPVGPDLFELLSISKKVWRDTGGAFDVTLGPLIDLWREAERTSVPPDKEAVDSALKRTGMQHIILDEGASTVMFDIEGVHLNLGAIGKGYALRQAAAVLREYGVESAFMSAGRSTVYAIGSQPCGDSWRVGIRHPRNFDENVVVVELRDKALSISGGVIQRDESIEERFEHIIDPLTGMPAEPCVASASVIADDPAFSDAFSTAIYLRGRPLAGRLMSSEGIQVVLVEPESDKFSVRKVG